MYTAHSLNTCTHTLDFNLKASPDGKSLGDCPFTQRANIALKLKGVQATYIIIDLHNKPKWFLEVNPAGSTPALQFGDRVIGDSYEIVQYLEKTYPNPSLNLPGNKEAEEATGTVFSAFSEWAKNSDTSKDAELESKFTSELEKVDKFLEKSPGAYLCDDTWSIADCVLVPRLYHLTTVARHYKKYTKFEGMPHLMRYMETAFSSEVFKATDYPREWILVGWAKYFQQ